MNASPSRTFADLEPAGLELAVTCQRCGHVAAVDDTAPRIRNQRLPALGTRRLVQRLEEGPRHVPCNLGPCRGLPVDGSRAIRNI